MHPRPRIGSPARSRSAPWLAMTLVSAAVLFGIRSEAAPQAPAKAPREKPVSALSSTAPAAVLSNSAWQDVPHSPVQPAESDQLVARALASAKIRPSPRTTDEQFLRRVTLDLTGELPVPADVTEFLAD